MNKLKFLLLPLLIVLSGCYIYKPYKYKSAEELATASSRAGAVSLRNDRGEFSRVPRTKQDANQKVREGSSLSSGTPSTTTTPAIDSAKIEPDERGGLPKSSFSKRTDDDKNIDKPQEKGETAPITDDVDSIKIKIQPNQYYKITAEEKQYKIQADQWEGDTLVSHILRKPKKILRFHKDQIEEESLLERRFSKPFSDLFTVGAYVVGGAVVLLLVL